MLAALEGADFGVVHPLTGFGRNRMDRMRGAAQERLQWQGKDAKTGRLRQGAPIGQREVIRGDGRQRRAEGGAVGQEELRLRILAIALQGQIAGWRGHQAVSLRAAEEGVHAPLAEPGAEDRLPRGGQGDRDLLLVAVGGKGEVVKEGERLPQEGREVDRGHPGGERIQEGLQGLPVGLHGGAVDGALEDVAHELHDERVSVRALLCHLLPLLARDRAICTLYSTRPPATHGFWYTRGHRPLLALGHATAGAAARAWPRGYAWESSMVSHGRQGLERLRFKAIQARKRSWLWRCNSTNRFDFAAKEKSDWLR